MKNRPIEKRLASLERQNLIFKTISVSGFALIAFLFFSGAKKAESRKTITAQRFVLIDEEGKELGTWGLKKVKLDGFDQPQEVTTLELVSERAFINVGNYLVLKDDAERAGLFISGERHASAKFFMDGRDARIEKSHLIMSGFSNAQTKITTGMEPTIEVVSSRKENQVLYPSK